MEAEKEGKRRSKEHRRGNGGDRNRIPHLLKEEKQRTWELSGSEMWKRSQAWQGPGWCLPKPKCIHQLSRSESSRGYPLPLASAGANLLHWLPRLPRPSYFPTPTSWHSSKPPFRKLPRCFIPQQPCSCLLPNLCMYLFSLPATPFLFT